MAKNLVHLFLFLRGNRSMGQRNTFESPHLLVRYNSVALTPSKTRVAFVGVVPNTLICV